MALIQAMAPVVYVQQLDAALITRRAEIFTQEKRIDLFSSHQPDGLMTQLMGENMMRKDGFEHQEERRQIFPSLCPRTVMQVWKTEFERSTQAVIQRLRQRQAFDLVRDFSLPVQGAALVAITGLRQMTPAKMDQVSQAMIDGCSNYIGAPSVTQACHAANTNIDAHIAKMIPELTEKPDNSILLVLIEAGQSMSNIQSNIKLVISGGQNEPRDAIAVTAAALLTHPNALDEVLQSGDWG